MYEIFFHKSSRQFSHGRIVFPGLLRVAVQPLRLLRGGGLHQRDGADEDGADAAAGRVGAALRAAAARLQGHQVRTGDSAHITLIFSYKAFLDNIFLDLGEYLIF